MEYFPLVLLGAHFLGDWILQPRKIAINKSKKISILFLHVVIVSLCLFFALSIKFSITESMPLIITNGLSHALLDWYGWNFYKHYFSNLSIEEHFSNYWFYFTIAIDQFIHLSIIFLLCL